MYKTETHMHTAESSSCASATGYEQARQYKQMGYSTIIVTDHFFNSSTTVDQSLPWNDRIDLYCKGYENALAEGEKIGLNVLFGVEYTWAGADFLAYGIDKQWLKQNSDLLDISVYEFCGRVHENGGIIVHAHPFRAASYIKDIRLLPDFCDGVEGYNARNPLEQMNSRAVWYADEFGLTVTAGSDCHDILSCQVYGNGKLYGVLTDEPITEIGQYIRLIKENSLPALYLPK